MKSIPKIGDKVRLLSIGHYSLTLDDIGKIFTIIDIEKGYTEYDYDYTVEGYGKKFFCFGEAMV